jgi:hypothetical protein
MSIIVNHPKSSDLFNPWYLWPALLHLF